MRIRRSLIIVLFAGGATACATTAASGPEALARLESARTANPSSEPVVRSLGIEYYKNNRLKDARAALEQAAKLDPRDGTAALYLGLTAEAQGDLAAARTAYSSYVEYGRTSRVRRSLESRLASLQRKELVQSVKTQLQQEQQLGGVPGKPNVVAVPPMRFSGLDTSLKPLERGMAELLTTDLARSSKITVVERMRIQALVDEIKLQQSGATDSASNVRAGKILQAGRMVQGSILQQGQQLRVDATVIDVPTARATGATNDNRTLDQLLTIEKNIALGLFQQMGVTLTTAERNAIEQRPTRALAAFLAYSRGLLREDEGKFDEANRFYQEAMRLDPGFVAARQKSENVERVIAGNQMTVQTIESGLDGTPEGRIVDQAGQGQAVGAGVSVGTAAVAAGDLNPPAAGAAATGAGPITSPPSRDPASAGTGLDNPTKQTARIEIRVQRP